MRIYMMASAQPTEHPITQEAISAMSEALKATPRAIHAHFLTRGASLVFTPARVSLRSLLRT
jgi:hypothetical protein